MYQVLARKYRPQTFADVVGQEHITTTLKNALASGRLHHAYLFTGARGIGKTTVARVLAKALNCTAAKDFEPCNVCSACLEITAGNSLDVQEIDGASNTSVEDVREIRERVKFMPSSGRYKIYIIDEVHMLSTSAFNALLKTLEEPPAHVVFIFATTEAHKIPATILSRCQRYDFRRIPAPLIAATLGRIAGDEGLTVEADALALVAREATGSMRDAESLLDQAVAFAGGAVTGETIKAMLGFLDRKLLFDALRAVVRHDAKTAIEVLDEVYATGADLSRFATDVLELVRHLLVVAECGGKSAPVDLMEDERALLDELARTIDGPRLHQMFSLWYSVADAVARSSFPKMLLEVGLIRLARVEPVKPIADIVARLDAVIGASAPVPAVAPSAATPSASRPTPTPQTTPPAKAVAPAAPEANPKPTFEPAPTGADADCERRWDEFMRWIVVQRPRIASIIQNGELEGVANGVVRMSFSNPLFAGMITEDDRRPQVEELLATFFKRPFRIAVEQSAQGNTTISERQQKKELMREALGSETVRKAADILDARVFDVKVDDKNV